MNERRLARRLTAVAREILSDVRLVALIDGKTGQVAHKDGKAIDRQKHRTRYVVEILGD